MTSIDSRQIVIADDHPLFRGALRVALSAQLPESNISEFESLHDLMHDSSSLEQADLLLLDLNMPGAHGFSGLVYICGNYADLPVVVVSANDDPIVMRQSIEYGAVGFIPKSTSSADISAAITQVLAGGVYLPKAAMGAAPASDESTTLAQRLAALTPHQYRVFTLMREGLLNKQIAFELGVSEATVKAHVTPILRKLGVNNRTQAVILGDKLAISAENSATEIEYNIV